MADTVERAADAAPPFESISALRDAHAQLLAALDRELPDENDAAAEAAAVLGREADASQFVARAAATGAFVDNLGDRTTATVLIEYWISTLQRAGVPAASVKLAPFDAKSLPILTGPCPFKGLEAFTSKDREYFFGRDGDIKALVELSDRSPLVIVSGASGSGKSSLVMSGALPVLAAAGFTVLPVIRPGSAVLDQAARAAQHDRPHPEDGARLRQDASRLLAWLGGEAATPKIFTIDQFEEVFTLGTGEDREALAASLAHVLGSGRRHRIILTIRQEFHTRIVELKPLIPYIETAWYSMRPMSYDDLRATIERPAAIVNLQFQPGIADDLVKKVLGQIAALPLLQFTLRALWKARDRNRITWEVYRKIGDPLTALKNSAEHFYESLAQETQREVKRILLELVRVDDFLEAYRRPVPRSTLLAAGQANTEDVLKLLVGNDYLALSSDRADEVLVEVKHESLIRNWPRYVTWIGEKRLDRRRRLTVTEGADRWIESGRNDELLLAGLQLDDATHYADLSEKEREFVGASLDAADRRRREVDEARDRRAREAQDRIRRQAAAKLRWLTAATLLVVAVAAAFAYLWRRSSVASAKASFLAELAGARFLAEADPTTGIAAIGVALARHREVVGDPEMSSAVLRSIFSVPDTPLTEAVFAHDKILGAIILQNRAAGDADIVGLVTRGRNDLRFWSRNGVLRRVFTGSEPLVAAFADATGSRVITVWPDGALRVFSADGQLLQMSGAGERVSLAAFSPDAQRMFEATAVGQVRVIDLDGREVGRFGGDVEDPVALSASADARLVLTLQNEYLRLWDVSTGRAQLLPDTDQPRSPAGLAQAGTPSIDPPRQLTTARAVSVGRASFAPKGHAVLALGNDGIARLWNPLAGREPVRRLGSADTRIATFTRDGDIVTVSNGNVVRFWSADGTERLAQQIPPTTPLNFSGDLRLLSSSGDKTLNVWDLQQGGDRNMVLRGHADVVVSAAFDATDRFVVTVSSDGSARLWNLAQTLAFDLRDRDGITSLAFSTDSSRFVTTGARTMRIWSARLAREREVSAPDTLLDARFSPDGQRIATGSVDKTGRIWSLPLMTPELADRSFQILKGHTDWVFRSSFSADSQHVLTVSLDRTARVWSLRGESELTLKGPQTAADTQDAGFSRDGRYIVTTDGLEPPKARVWDWANRSPEPREVLAVDAPFGRTDLSPDGRYLATSDSERVHLWDLSSKASAATIVPGTAPDAGKGIPFAFAASGAWLFTATPDGAVAQWDLRGRKLRELKAGGNNGAMLSPDDRLIVTVGEELEPRLRLWNWSGQLLATIPGEAVTISPDGSLLVSTVRGGRARRIWPLSLSGFERRLDTLRLPCLTFSQLSEGLLLEEKEARIEAARCGTAFNQPGPTAGAGQ